MDERWRTAFDLLAQSHFADVAGARLALTLPVSDRLLTALLRSHVPPAGAVRELELRAESGHQLAIRLRLSTPAFFPPLTVRLRIERQPVLPDTPVIRLRIASRIAAFAAQLLAKLPPWVRLEDDRLDIDLAALARQYQALDLFNTISSLSVTTTPGTVVLDLHAALPPASEGHTRPVGDAVHGLDTKD